MVVKYDNTPAAQPHRGLTSADVVYVEPVEWGLTRIAAVFSTDLPEAVGPIRSARISDIDLLAQYGNVAFVFSGAQQRLWPKIEAADWIPLSQDGGSPGFYRERGTGQVRADEPDGGHRRPAEGCRGLGGALPGHGPRLRRGAPAGGEEGQDGHRQVAQRERAVPVERRARTPTTCG